MSNRVLILQKDRKSITSLKDHFSKRGDKVWIARDVSQAWAIIKSESISIALIDMHLTGDDWLKLIVSIKKNFPKTGIIITNKNPDLHKEMMAKERGAKVFLRQPFTKVWIEKALKNLKKKGVSVTKPSSTKKILPRVRLPMRTKITLPYALLALVFAVTSAFIVSRYVLESIQDRFNSQLIDVGKLSADWMVNEESRMLETLRLVANAEGVAEAVLDGDSDRLREIVLPIAINYQEEALEILDTSGVSLLSLQHQSNRPVDEYESSRGSIELANIDFVQRVLQGNVDEIGDKYSGLARTTLGDYLYIAGPLFDDQGNFTGVVVIGKTLETLSRSIRQDTLAHLTFYGLDGNVLGSTLFLPEDIYPLSSEVSINVLASQDEASTVREITVASTIYSEILGPWEARAGDDIGIIGASLAQNFFVRPTIFTQIQLFALVVIVFLGVVVLGVVLAYQITRPLSQVVRASTEVAKGNLEVKVPTKGNDEVMVLAHAFNHMVSGLQEGFIYRDLLGRTVSPEVRDALRYSFASGNLRLEGQNTVATVLMSDIRGFTSLSENEEPTIVLKWLNEYFGEIVPIITSHGGVVDKFEGDALVAFFGILPTPLSAMESSHQACRAALEVLTAVEKINIRRTERDEPPLVTGIGVNTGKLTAGSLGTTDRLNYTIIGDTVNTTQRIESVTREFGMSAAVVSEDTFIELSDQREDFRFESIGEYKLKGKLEKILLYRLMSAKKETSN